MDFAGRLDPLRPGVLEGEAVRGAEALRGDAQDLEQDHQRAFVLFRAGFEPT